MISMNLEEVAASVDGQLQGITPQQAKEMRVLVAGTDSRLPVRNGLFVAIKGEHVDGHDFLKSAAAHGFVAAIVDHTIEGASLPLVVVPETVAALGLLARHNIEKRRALGTPFTLIGITGSVGKTTTKDLTKTLLASLAPTVSPIGSFNNEIGLPLTALMVDKNTRYFVAEMGANHLGEIQSLTHIAPPDLGVELKVGTAHVGEFGGVENIYEAKSELVEALPHDGKALLNAGDPNVVRMAARTQADVVWFGLESDASDKHPLTVMARSIGSDEFNHPSFQLVVEDHCVGRVQLGLVGRHNVINAVAAATIAWSVGMAADAIATGLNASVALSPHRMALCSLDADGTPFILLDDTFNANPDSMKAALDALATLSTAQGDSPHTVAVLGPMLELGDEGEKLHRGVGAYATQSGIDTLITVGISGDESGQKLANAYAEGAQTSQSGDSVLIRHATNAGEAKKMILEEVATYSRCIVLLKGSHASGLSSLADDLARYCR
ncbi:MAG: UDP-N-acetylmuramoyl-tripeptide--D-alanyl-D-alanine ligase [Bifidobacteriaceae bacterium]|nr:UDP-N-acetylmuramoyl-tripeptide--D-alanyl-D-alanine ligase [Aeriscardovia sp.]MEE1324049.1 UDP-N-acetylmuramoyl-tripeptide--D-alanyl-D-alanine ligase [Bifidobacteriaceae bacterium]